MGGTDVLVAAAAMLSLSCYDPVYPTRLACSAEGTCPPGQTCGAGGQCEVTPDAAVRPRLPDAAAPDAAENVVARAGNDLTVPVKTPVSLSGRASFDWLARPLSYAWTLAAAPAGSVAELRDAATAQPSFVPDVAGDYVVRLVVSAGAEQGSDSVTISAVNLAPVVDGGPDVATNSGEAVALRGGASDGNGDALTLRWSIVQSPAGSHAELRDAGSLVAALVPDIEGEYRVELAASDGTAETHSAPVRVTSYHAVARLRHRVVDAEVSRPLGRLVMIDGAPDALYLYDPVTEDETQVLLPLAAAALAVSPDGSTAAVGHDGYVSWVDLRDGKIVKTCPIAAEVTGLVLAGDGHAYAFTSRVSGDVIGIDPACAQTDPATGQVNAGTTGKLHPSGDRIYAAEDFDSPSGLAVLGVSGGAAVLRARSTDFDHPACHGLWLTEDGARIVTACGFAFRATTDPATDMQYAGRLPGFDTTTVVRHADHTAKAGKIAVIPGPESTALFYFDPIGLRSAGGRELPPICEGGVAHGGHGRFVFLDGDGAHVRVILRADPDVPLTFDHGVTTFAL
jgi:chitinase